jgi:hypothetical protein
VLDGNPNKRNDSISRDMMEHMKSLMQENFLNVTIYNFSTYLWFQTPVQPRQRPLFGHSFKVLQSPSRRAPPPFPSGYFTCNPSSSNWVVPSVGSFQDTRSFVNCSIVGLNFVSIREKSSTLPTLRILMPGNAAPTRYMSEPHVEQKKLVMVFSFPGSLTKTVFD